MSGSPIRGWLPFAATAIAFGAGILLAALALLGTSPSERASAAAVRPALKPVGSCNGLRHYLRRYRGATGAPLGVAGDSVAAPPFAEGGASAPAQNASPTNVQEAGVDEPDIVKTAGSTIFSVDGDRLRAVDASTGTPVLSSSLKLPGRSADYQLLVAGDRLLAIGSSYGYAVPLATGAFATTDVGFAGEPRTVLAEVDISDPASIGVLRTTTIEGSYVSARLEGSTVRLVSSDYPPPVVGERGHGRALVPRVTSRDLTTGKTRRGKLVGCGAISHPARFSGTELLSVLTIDLERGLPAIDVDSVLAGGEIVYASPTALYVATERWTDPQDGDAATAVSTEIHRFDTTDPDSTTYVASGRVPGYMLSQWSMSEQDGLLRVASTTAPPWDPDSGQQGSSESFVTVLAADGDRLREVGSVGGIGKGEDIYAVRFIGDLGYVVSFRQVDPLYVVDLADPTAPRVAGELKIPGYSAYLHPVGPGLLLGIGREASASGAVGGVQASLFDVSDPTHPVRLDRERFGDGSSTEVEYDHHAFSWFADQSLAMLPLDSYYYGGPGFHGAVGLRVAPGTADPLGRVAKLSGGRSYDAQIRRALELGGRIYTIAANRIDAYEPATLAPAGSLEL